MGISTVLVTGASGGIGTLLVPALQARGMRVRAMIRTPDKATALVDGVEPVVADLSDPRAVAAALDGVDAAFLNSPSTPDAADVQTRFADLARRAGVPRLVLLSQYEARADSPVRFLRWHAVVEAHVRTLDLEYTVLRPNLFMQGLLGFAGMIAAHGRFGAPIGNSTVSVIDTRDIADAAAVVLAEAGHTGRTYTLTGPRAVTHHEIARALSDATGRQIAFTDVPPSAFAASLREILPAWQVDGLVEDYEHYARGEASAVHSAVADITGRPARDLVDFARDYAGAFAPTQAPISM